MTEDPNFNYYININIISHPTSIPIAILTKWALRSRDSPTAILFFFSLGQDGVRNATWCVVVALESGIIKLHNVLCFYSTRTSHPKVAFHLFIENQYLCNTCPWPHLTCNPTRKQEESGPRPCSTESYQKTPMLFTHLD